MLAQSSTSPQDTALLAELLSLPNDGRYPALALSPEQRRQRTLEALVSQMEALTRQNPVLIIFEDAHWTDPEPGSVRRAVGRIASLRALLIVTFRPEFEALWIGLPHVTARTINRLAQRDIDAMIDRVVGNKVIPATSGKTSWSAPTAFRFRGGDDEGGAGGGKRTRGRARGCGGSIAGAPGARQLARLADGGLDRLGARGVAQV